jgi:hypothetical protein
MTDTVTNSGCERDKDCSVIINFISEEFELSFIWC